MYLQKILLDSLCSEKTYEDLRKLDEDNILQDIIPQINHMKIVGECKYHKVNVYEHSLKALKELFEILNKDEFFPSHLKEAIDKYLSSKVDEDLTKLEVLKLGLFLHDIGKYSSKTVDETGRVHFRGHEITGEDICLKLGKHLDLSKDVINLLCKYVRHHMILLVLYKTNDMPKKRLFEIYNLLDEDIIGILLLGYADIVSTRRLLDPNEDMGVIKTYMEYVLTNYIYRYK